MKSGDINMSYDTERYDFEKLPNQGLAIIQCGLQICHSGHSSGKLFYPDYSAHFILKGKGVYYVNNKSYELSAGQGFMITPNIPNIYTADEAEPWQYIYATFKGADAEALVKRAGLDDDNVTFSFPMDSDTTHYLKRMHSAGKSHLAKGYDALGYFLLVMSKLIEKYNESKSPKTSSQHYIRHAISYIDDHSSYGISINDVANFVGVDRTHLYRLFMKHMGISPSQHLIEVRLKHAISLMEYEELSISEIATSTGFYDLSHFSKAFYTKYKMMPGKYRSLHYKL